MMRSRVVVAGVSVGLLATAIVVPVGIIQGGADLTVPVSDSERLPAAADTGTTDRWLVPDGRHAESYYADPQGYLDRVTSFFASAMP